jgi:hypothetical protein
MDAPLVAIYFALCDTPYLTTLPTNQSNKLALLLNNNDGTPNNLPLFHNNPWENILNYLRLYHRNGPTGVANIRDIFRVEWFKKYIGGGGNQPFQFNSVKVWFAPLTHQYTKNGMDYPFKVATAVTKVCPIHRQSVSVSDQAGIELSFYGVEQMNSIQMSIDHAGIGNILDHSEIKCGLNLDILEGLENTGRRYCDRIVTHREEPLGEAPEILLIFPAATQRYLWKGLEEKIYFQGKGYEFVSLVKGDNNHFVTNFKHSGKYFFYDNIANKAQFIETTVIPDNQFRGLVELLLFKKIQSESNGIHDPQQQLLPQEQPDQQRPIFAYEWDTEDFNDTEIAFQSDTELEGLENEETMLVEYLRKETKQLEIKKKKKSQKGILDKQTIDEVLPRLL